MLIYNLFHFFFGYVIIKAEGGFPERFINLCTAEGIPLWSIRKSGDALHACTSIAGWKRIRIPARKSGMRVSLKSKKGLPFFTYRHRKRIFLPIGFAVFFSLLLMLSGRVWVIEVQGNETVGSHTIELAFDRAGLRIGSKASQLKLIEIKANALSELKDITWSSVNIRGCTAVIEVREGTKSPEIEHEGSTSNIVASKDGQIQIIEPYRGTAAVKPGQTVTKGDLLISGITQSKNEFSLFSDANGYAAATTEIKVVSQTPKSRSVYTTKIKKVYSIYILGKELGFKPRAEGECYLNESRLCIKGTRLPFGINYRLYTKYEKKEQSLSSDEARLTTLEHYAIKAHTETLHAQIISEKVEAESTNNSITVRGKYMCYENIGMKKALDVEETAPEPPKAVN